MKSSVPNMVSSNHFYSMLIGGIPMARWLMCNIVVSEFKLKSCDYVHSQTITAFGKVGTHSSLPDIGSVVPQLFSYKDDFGICY